MQRKEFDSRPRAETRGAEPAADAGVGKRDKGMTGGERHRAVRELEKDCRGVGEVNQNGLGKPKSMKGLELNLSAMTIQ